MTTRRSRPIVSRRSRTKPGGPVGGELGDGRGVARMFEASAAGDVARLQIVMEALLSADVAWSPTDLADADHPVPVIVLNGNGVPGIGEAYPNGSCPGGFRVAISQNASAFDHPRR